MGLTTAEGIGFGIKAADTLANLWSTHQANKMNKQLFEKQLDYNWRAMEAQQNYNSPVNQRKMLEEAGYSPYALFMQNGQASSGMSSSSSAPNMQPVYNGSFGNAFDSAVAYENSVADRELKESNKAFINEQRAAQAIENRYKTIDIMLDLWNKAENAQGTRSKRLYQDLLFKFDDETFQDRVKKWKEDARQAEEAANRESELAHLAHLQTIAQDKQNAWIDKLNERELAKKLAEIDVLHSQKKVNDQERQRLYKETLKAEAEKHGIDVNNEVLDNTKDELIRNAELTNDKLHNDVINSYNPFRDPNRDGKIHNTIKGIGDVYRSIFK